MQDRITLATNCLAWFRITYPNLQRNIWPSIPCDICLLYDTQFIGINIYGSVNDGVFSQVIEANLGGYYVINTFDDFKAIIYDLVGKP